MYEPERIYVQNAGGIDPGVAALMQNASKGNMDPAALMAMMNNNGMNGNGGWWWIWIILIWCCWGGNGFGGFGGNNGASQLASQLNTDNNTDLLMQALQGNKDAIQNLSNTLNCDINTINTALSTINSSVSQIACDTKLSAQQVINAITAGDANLASQMATCCCNIRTSIGEVNNSITKMGYENQLSNCQQTNTLTNAIQAGFNSILSDNCNRFNLLNQQINAQTQVINDGFCSLEKREMQREINALRDEKFGYQLAASQQNQTSNIINTLRPTPVPAFLTVNPFCNCSSTTTSTTTSSAS